jgi:6-phospho-beta-glucosidase
VAALLHHRARLDLTELRLHDLDVDHLDVVARLAQGMSDAVGGALRVRACPRLDEAIAGADAILNSTRPGGLTARLVDETVPVALGVPGQETVGPGGYFFARRSVPEALRVADVMASEAPQAWLLNYTNPTNLVTQALTARAAACAWWACAISPTATSRCCATRWA